MVLPQKNNKIINKFIKLSWIQSQAGSLINNIQTLKQQ